MRKPPWLRAKVPGGAGYQRLKGIMDRHRLHTVCEEAGCPNMGECWSRGVDDHDSRRHVHAGVWFLQREDREAGNARSR